jgi:hypothetical protein
MKDEAALGEKVQDDVLRRVARGVLPGLSFVEKLLRKNGAGWTVSVEAQRPQQR